MYEQESLCLYVLHFFLDSFSSVFVCFIPFCLFLFDLSYYSKFYYYLDTCLFFNEKERVWIWMGET